MYANKLTEITTFVLDVDGVMTNGDVLVTDEGSMLRTFNIKDGFAMQLAVKLGYRICVITGGNSAGVMKRLQGLGIKDIYTQVHEKRPVFLKYMADNNLSSASIAYMGDDIPDYLLLKEAGLKCCPSDASHDIQSICDFISAYPGGGGCVRDLIEKVLRAQGKWDLDQIGIW
jgi:3-deoxy-D-manno-octulosonate 8-phosphate phosphatase (KDO 8-P phosphatase)